VLDSDDLGRQLSTLPPDAIVLLLSLLAEGERTTGRPSDIAATVARASAPVYSLVEVFLGRGIVGGYMTSFARMGVDTADMVLDVLSGVPLSGIPPHSPPFTSRFRASA